MLLFCPQSWMKFRKGWIKVLLGVPSVWLQPQTRVVMNRLGDLSDWMSSAKRLMRWRSRMQPMNWDTSSWLSALMLLGSRVTSSAGFAKRMFRWWLMGRTKHSNVFRVLVILYGICACDWKHLVGVFSTSMGTPVLMKESNDRARKFCWLHLSRVTVNLCSLRIYWSTRVVRLIRISQGSRGCPLPWLYFGSIAVIRF